VRSLVIGAAVDAAGVDEGELLAATETSATDTARETGRVKDGEMNSHHEVTAAEWLVTASTACTRRPACDVVVHR